MRCLVTGGAGFIGSHVTASLLERGDAVVILDNLSTGREANLDGLAGDLTLVRGDVADAALVERSVAGVDAIIHHAAVASVAASIEDPLRCDEVNVHGTVRLLEAARRHGVRRFILAASAAAYGDDPALPKHERLRPCPMSPYAASKVAAEHYVRVFAQLHGLSAVSLRYFNVFGPRQDPEGEYAAVIPKLIARMLEGMPPLIFGDGQQTRDFCYVQDVAEANLRALALSDARGQVMNIAGGSQISILELTRLLGELIGSETAPEHRQRRTGDVRHSWADISLARELLGWAPRHALADGLRQTVEHFREAR